MALSTVGEEARHRLLTAYAETRLAAPPLIRREWGCLPKDMVFSADEQYLAWSGIDVENNPCIGFLHVSSGGRAKCCALGLRGQVPPERIFFACRDSCLIALFSTKIEFYNTHSLMARHRYHHKVTRFFGSYNWPSFSAEIDSAVVLDRHLFLVPTDENSSVIIYQIDPYHGVRRVQTITGNEKVKSITPFSSGPLFIHYDSGSVRFFNFNKAPSQYLEERNVPEGFDKSCELLTASPDGRTVAWCEHLMPAQLPNRVEDEPRTYAKRILVSGFDTGSRAFSEPRAVWTYQPGDELLRVSALRVGNDTLTVLGSLNSTNSKTVVWSYRGISSSEKPTNTERILSQLPHVSNPERVGAVSPSGRYVGLSSQLAHESGRPVIELDIHDLSPRTSWRRLLLSDLPVQNRPTVCRGELDQSPHNPDIYPFYEISPYGYCWRQCVPPGAGGPQWVGPSLNDLVRSLNLEPPKTVKAGEAWYRLRKAYPFVKTGNPGNRRQAPPLPCSNGVFPGTFALMLPEVARLLRRAAEVVRTHRTRPNAEEDLEFAHFLLRLLNYDDFKKALNSSLRGTEGDMSQKSFTELNASRLEAVNRFSVCDLHATSACFLFILGLGCFVATAPLTLRNDIITAIPAIVFVSTACVLGACIPQFTRHLRQSAVIDLNSIRRLPELDGTQQIPNDIEAPR